MAGFYEDDTYLPRGLKNADVAPVEDPRLANSSAVLRGFPSREMPPPQRPMPQMQATPGQSLRARHQALLGRADMLLGGMQRNNQSRAATELMGLGGRMGGHFLTALRSRLQGTPYEELVNRIMSKMDRVPMMAEPVEHDASSVLDQHGFARYGEAGSDAPRARMAGNAFAGYR